MIPETWILFVLFPSIATSFNVVLKLSDLIVPDEMIVSFVFVKIAVLDDVLPKSIADCKFTPPRRVVGTLESTTSFVVAE